MKKKIRLYEIILCVFMFAVIVAGLFMPKTGVLVMVDEICDILVIWSVCVCVIVRIILGRGQFTASVRIVRMFVITACVVIGILFTGDVALDLVSGTKTVQLSEIQVRRSQTHTGLFSLHYYLIGTDRQGERIQLEISGDDYTRLSGSNSVTIEYYKHTGRIVRYI